MCFYEAHVHCLREWMYAENGECGIVLDYLIILDQFVSLYWPCQK